MTGEMHAIAPDGTDSNGDTWEIQAAVATALGCKLRPFDKYIGPYIDHPAGHIFIGEAEGCDFLLTACLWPDGIAPAYRQPQVSTTFWNEAGQAIAAVMDMLETYRATRRPAPRVYRPS